MSTFKTRIASAFILLLFSSIANSTEFTRSSIKSHCEDDLTTTRDALAKSTIAPFAKVRANFPDQTRFFSLGIGNLREFEESIFSLFSLAPEFRNPRDKTKQSSFAENNLLHLSTHFEPEHKALLEIYQSERHVFAAYLEAIRDELQTRYEKQRNIVAETLDWILERGTVPRSQDIQYYVRLSTSKETRPAFKSSSSRWLAVRRSARKRGIPFSLTDVQIKTASVSEEYRSALQEDALAKIIDWITENQKIPRTKDFKSFGLNWSRFSGTGNYSDGEARRSAAIFDSSYEAWIAVGQAARKRGIPFSLTDVQIKTASVSEEYRSALQEDALVRIIDWMTENQKIPTSEDFKSFGLNWARFSGVGNYSDGGTNRSAAIFDSPYEAWIAVRQVARKRGIPFSLTDVLIKSASTNEEYRSALQADAVAIVIDWVIKHQSHPKTKDFKLMGFSRPRFLGMGNYADGKEARSAAIFDSPSDAWLAVKNAALERGIAFSIATIKVKSPSPEFIRAQKDEIASLNRP